MTVKEKLKSIKVQPSRELFVGPAGCGKSEHLLKIFEERLAAENPLDPKSFFVVPSQEHAERVTKILTARGLAGFFSSRVTTLDDLIEKAFETPNPPAASNLTKIAVMRKILAEDCGVYFEKIRDKPGFLNLMLNFISELKDHCWTAEAFRAEMARLKKLEPGAALKYQSLALVYERYDAALRELGLRDRRDMLAAYRVMKKKGSVKAASFHTLCFDGFFDFTPLQKESMEELLSGAERGAAALTWDKERASVFEPVSATQALFAGMGFEVRVLGKDLPRFKNPDLMHLSRQIFSAAEKIKPREDGLDWFEAPDPETEAEMIARKILNFLSAEQCRPSQIAVLFRSVRPHRAIFETVFRRFGIPFEIHERERLSESEWIQTAARLVRLFREDWKKEDWIGFLRSALVTRFGVLPKDERGLHGFEGWCWRKGLRGGIANWKAAFESEKAGAADPDVQAAEAWFRFFLELEAEWRRAETPEAWGAVMKRALYRDFGMLECLKAHEKSEGFEHELSAPARFEKILEEMAASFAGAADAPDRFERFADDFLRLVELDLFSLPHLNQNAVQVYDVSLARQKEYEIVFVAGLAEKEFPQQIREDPLLSDWERRLIQGQNLGAGKNKEAKAGQAYALPERKLRQQLEKYLFYLAVTRARRHVCLSHARRDEEGKAVLRSFYLEELTACFEGSWLPEIKKDTQPYPSLEEIRTEKDLHLAAVGALFNPWEMAEERDLVALLLEAWKSNLFQAHLRKALVQNQAAIGDAKILNREAFHPSASSPTRLEAYARCSYLYFAERVLKLQETEADTRARVQGTIMHGVLEDFFKAAWRGLSQEETLSQIDALLEKYAAQEPLDLGPHQTALATLEMKNMLVRFIAFERERLEESAFQPRHFEYEIPKDKPVTLRRDDTELVLQGKIDRVDVDAQNQFFVISDYKRSRNFDKNSLEDGTSLQLPLYLLAVEKVLGLKPAGGQLLNLKDLKATGFYSEAVAEAKTKMGAEAFDAVLRRALRYSARYLRELAEGRIEVLPRDCADKCGFSPLCRIEKWRLPEIAEKIRVEDKKLGF